MKTYLNRSGTYGHTVLVTDADGERMLPFHSRHSPTGWAWGYGGSGPAQLALDILWDHLDEEPPGWLYQQFKTDVIGRLEQGKPWSITGEQIDEWLNVSADPGADPWGKGRAFLDARRTAEHEPEVTVPATEAAVPARLRSALEAWLADYGPVDFEPDLDGVLRPVAVQWDHGAAHYAREIEVIRAARDWLENLLTPDQP
jgi:hypothetical protein